MKLVRTEPERTPNGSRTDPERTPNDPKMEIYCIRNLLRTAITGSTMIVTAASRLASPARTNSSVKVASTVLLAELVDALSQDQVVQHKK